MILLELKNIVIDTDITKNQFEKFFNLNENFVLNFIEQNQQHIIDNSGGLANLVVNYDWVDSLEEADELYVDESDILEENEALKTKIDELEKEIAELKAAGIKKLCAKCGKHTQHISDSCVQCLIKVDLHKNQDV